MSTALALPGGVMQINACGRILEISAEGAFSLPKLRRELVGKLRVCNPASVQLTDLTGKIVQTDADLMASVRDGKVPLQAKLTLAALHEIEQKKRDGKSKEHDMASLQWHIVVEQVAAFSNELASMGSHLQSMHDDSQKIVQQFEDTERIRREELMTLIHLESQEREARHRELLERLEEVAHLVVEEKSVHEVSVYQINKQIDQAVGDFNAGQKTTLAEFAQVERSLASLRHDLDLEMRKNGAAWTRNADSLRQLELRDHDQVSACKACDMRVSAMEADHSKLCGDVARLESSVAKESREFHLRLSKHSEELTKASRDGGLMRGHELTCMAMDHESSWQTLESHLRQAREEALKANTEMAERTKTLELRCAALEKESIDRWDEQHNKDANLHDMTAKAMTEVDTAKVKVYAKEAVMRSVLASVQDLGDRMKLAEGQLNLKLHSEHAHSQWESFSQMVKNQDAKLAQVERQLYTRISQEATNRENAFLRMQKTIQTSFEGLSEEEVLKMTDPKPAVSHARVSSPVRPSEDLEETRPVSRTFVRSISPTHVGRPPPTTSLSSTSARGSGSAKVIAMSTGQQQQTSAGSVERVPNPTNPVLSRHRSLSGGNGIPVPSTGYAWTVRSVSPGANSCGGR
eukprot:TRINITY_DN76576_c0_g1_i1.p1 TRINITY_DN76576_c0_g1~~TRINITY_DN76576_c0_g1_i1.p1  ORF type:complete len:654 (-),score=126.17 TRINITY_DN76576_c0_g1_i1:180-2081(-)